MLSFHDFHRTPPLRSVYERMRRFSPEFYKIVSTARSLADNLEMLHFAAEIANTANIVALCMGEAGIPSRVLSLRAGSAFTFGSAGAGEETAPGQMAARTLLETYRIDQVDRATKVYGVAGDPVRSSLSPLMLNTAFRRETANAVYLPLQTSGAEDLFRFAREVPLSGFSVTMPLKLSVMPFLERMDALSGEDRCGEHRAAGSGRKVLRLQHGRGRDRHAVGAAAQPARCPCAGAWGGRCRARGGLRAGSQGRGGEPAESHA